MSLQLQRSAAVSGKEPEMGHQQEVVAHVYDVACVGPDGASGGGATVLHFNRIFKDAIGLGGIFHTAIQVRTHSPPPHLRFSCILSSVLSAMPTRLDLQPN
jgi:hypothetical protein